MGKMASQITSLTIVYSTVNLSADLRKHRSSAPMAGTGEFPAQRASNAENVSIWWVHHEYVPIYALYCVVCCFDVDISSVLNLDLGYVCRYENIASLTITEWHDCQYSIPNGLGWTFTAPYDLYEYTPTGTHIAKFRAHELVNIMRLEHRHQHHHHHHHAARIYINSVCASAKTTMKTTKSFKKIQVGFHEPGVTNTTHPIHALTESQQITTKDQLCSYFVEYI